MNNASHQTISIKFKSRRKWLRFRAELKCTENKDYIDSYDRKWLWLKFDTAEVRDLMMKTLKSTIPKYDIKVRNEKEVIYVL